LNEIQDDILDGATDGTTTFAFAPGPRLGRCSVRKIRAGRGLNVRPLTITCGNGLTPTTAVLLIVIWLP
jgi:hypothetical protein